MNETPPAPGPLLRYTSGAHKQQPRSQLLPLLPATAPGSGRTWPPWVSVMKQPVSVCAFLLHLSLGWLMVDHAADVNTSCSSWLHSLRGLLSSSYGPFLSQKLGPRVTAVRSGMSPTGHFPCFHSEPSL